jgi:L-histidine N-alpha-methyltransferase
MPSVEIAPGLQVNTLARDVRSGLTQAFKELPPKHLYDDRGSELFDQICGLPEYYPTRTERAILESSAASIIAQTGAAELVELGSGTAAKTRHILDAMQAAGTLDSYVPFDISEIVVRDSAQAIAGEYPELREVQGIVGDFEQHLGLIPAANGNGPRMVALLGGTIGKLPAPRPSSDPELDRRTAGIRGPPAAGGRPGQGSRGHPRRLQRCRRRDGRIEMRLRAQADCTVHIPVLDLDVSFAAGEEMRTEISAKFTPERIATDLQASGLTLVDLYSDEAELYSLILAKPSESDPD